MNTERFRKESDEVLYDLEPVVRISRKDVDFLKETAEHNERKRIRLCAHGSIEDSLHEMVITHAKGTYVRPHKHLGKIESFHVIEGTVDVVVFDDDGNITGVTRMGDYQSGQPFYHRISEPSYHTLLITSDVLVFHEITNGPFRREDMVYADWSPEENDKQAGADFIADLSAQSEQLLETA
jgi:cupin fold WbuC family metalloprotein